MIWINTQHVSNQVVVIKLLRRCYEIKPYFVVAIKTEITILTRKRKTAQVRLPKHGDFLTLIVKELKISVEAG